MARRRFVRYEVRRIETYLSSIAFLLRSLAGLDEISWQELDADGTGQLAQFLHFTSFDEIQFCPQVASAFVIDWFIRSGKHDRRNGIPSGSHRQPGEQFEKPFINGILRSVTITLGRQEPASRSCSIASCPFLARTNPT